MTTASATGSTNTATTRSNTRVRRVSWRPSPRDRSRTPTAKCTTATRAINVNIYGTYENSWGGHHFKATAGGQYEDYRSTSLDVKQTDLSSDNIDSFTVATGPITLSQSISAYRTLGFFGRVNYDYEGRYIFEASAAATVRHASSPTTAGDSSPRHRPHGASARSRSSNPCGT